MMTMCGSLINLEAFFFGDLAFHFVQVISPGNVPDSKHSNSNGNESKYFDIPQVLRVSNFEIGKVRKNLWKGNYAFDDEMFVFIIYQRKL